MTESTLPLTGPKPQQSAPGQSICAANARKLAVLLVLLLSGCAGLGFKFWLEIKASSIALDQMIGSHEVLAPLRLVWWFCTGNGRALHFAECINKPYQTHLMQLADNHPMPQSACPYTHQQLNAVCYKL